MPSAKPNTKPVSSPEISVNEDSGERKKRNAIAALVAALRPKQWTKNGLLFAGLLFTLDQSHVRVAIWHACAGFLLFCALSSSAYLLNDVIDVENDRQHPTKRHRPIAAGEISVGAAIALSAILGVAAIVISYTELDFRFGLAASAYFAATLCYSLFLKHMVILDLLVLAFCYVLRAVAGAWAIPVGISYWLVLCAFLLALFLGIEKRQGELIAVQAGRRGGRKILSEYSSEMLIQMSTIVTSSLLMSYALYTIQSEAARKHPYLMATIPFVLYGIFRYLYLIHRKSMGESPDEVLIKDKPLLINILLWALATGLIVTHPFWK